MRGNGRAKVPSTASLDFDKTGQRRKRFSVLRRGRKGVGSLFRKRLPTPFLCRAVKEFLLERPGAKPKLWMRWPWEDEYSAPYCEDWQVGMHERLTKLERLGGPANNVVGFYPVRNGKGGTHNYVMMVPKGKVRTGTIRLQSKLDSAILCGLQRCNVGGSFR